jgi:hypothetical protein
VAEERPKPGPAGGVPQGERETRRFAAQNDSAPTWGAANQKLRPDVGPPRGLRATFSPKGRRVGRAPLILKLRPVSGAGRLVVTVVARFEAPFERSPLE